MDKGKICTFFVSKDRVTHGIQNEKGLGLGFHIVRALGEKCKGGNSVELQINQGTTNILSIPK